MRATDTHPSAAWIHEQLRPEFPSLSLATVYRNLEILSETGQIDPVSVPGGPARYDGNLGPHQHFICDACGRIDDLDLRTPPGMLARLKRKYRLSARRVRIDFYGLCAACTARKPDHSE
jgi:Fur family peroxide stress response transcriptional regulator